MWVPLPCLCRCKEVFLFVGWFHLFFESVKQDLKKSWHSVRLKECFVLVMLVLGCTFLVS